MTTAALVRISENNIINIDNIALAKRVSRKMLGDMGQFTKEIEIGTEIVLKGDGQIYQYYGEPGNILWNILQDAAFPAYLTMDENILAGFAPLNNEPNQAENEP
jgi:hypothetical protein